MNSEILNRKGARKVADVPAQVLELLNKGEIETVNLTEWLAIDHVKLVQHNFQELGIAPEIIDAISDQVVSQKKPTTMNSVKLIGSILHDSFNEVSKRDTIFHALSNHKSDTIRCYAPYLISLDNKLFIQEKFDKIKNLVADKHFGIREVVWMAMRPEIEKNLEESIEFLSTWTESEDENVRRFTTESTRPRGVWCKHIEELKANPQLALAILDPLKSDASKYVQDSVANWLNDASKTQPNFVINLCEIWNKESPTKETAKIIKRAKRSLVS